MTNSQSNSSRPNRNGGHRAPSNFTLLIGLFRKHFLLLLVPVALFSASAAAYILTRQPVWRATQTLQIRDELAMQTVMPGRFNSLDMMKMAQETIHETVRRHSVVAKVLQQLDPPENYESTASWPSVEDIESMQGSISLSPPNGAEFGRTEVLLLSVKAESTERAKKIVGLLAQELKFQLNELRDKRAASIENELDESVRLATEDLEKSNNKLAEFEKGVGDILVDLRSVTSETGSGGTTLHSRINSLLVEIRVARTRRDVLSKQLDNIRQAAIDPDQVLSFSSELLAAQPSLKKLKDELISIQTNTAMKLGQFEKYHPKAKAAMEAENVVKEKILDEVRIAETGLASQVGVIEEQIKRMEKSENALHGQLQNLAENRAPYSALLKMVDQRRKVLNKALEDRARAKASRAAARTTSLVTLLDEPYSGSRPEGMSKKIVVGAAGFAGLLSGIGLVFFAASPSFVGPMGSRSDDSDSTVTLPDWKTEALQAGQISAARGSEPSPGEPDRQVVQQPNRRPTTNSRGDDMEILKVDFQENESVLNDEVDFDEMFGESLQVHEPKTDHPSRHVEPFRLEPRQKDSRLDFDSESDTDVSLNSPTMPDNIDEDSLRELHRRQIDEMLRDED